MSTASQNIRKQTVSSRARAQQRARSRLVVAHYEEYRQLYEVELRKEGLTPSAPRPYMVGRRPERGSAA